MQSNRPSPLWLIFIFTLFVQGCLDGNTIRKTSNGDNSETPTLNIVGPEQVEEQSQITLNAQFSSEVAVASYNWQQTSGPTVTFDQHNQSSFSFLTPTVSMTDGPQPVTIHLVVVTADQRTLSSDFITTVEPVNQAPTVLSQSISITEGQPSHITLNVEDTDGTIDRIEWVQTSGPQIDFISSSINTINFVTPMVDESQRVDFTATIWDNEQTSTTYAFFVLIVDQIQSSTPKILLDSSELTLKPYAPIYADWNQDGKDDVVVIDYLDGQAAVYYYQNKGDGTFVVPPTRLITLADTDTMFNAPAAMTKLDINQDGLPEVILASRKGNALSSIDLASSEPVVNIIDNATLGNLQVKAADVDGDGQTDIVTNSDGTLYWYKNRGNAQFVSKVLLTTIPSNPMNVRTSPLVFGDFDNDGNIDFVQANWQNSIQIHWGLGSGQFDAPQDIPMTWTQGDVFSPSSLFAEDLDHDGKRDILLTLQNRGNVRAYINQGQRAFKEWIYQGDSSLLVTAATMKDTDNDGVKELYMVDRSGRQDPDGGPFKEGNHLIMMTFPGLSWANTQMLAYATKGYDSIDFVQFDEDQTAEIALSSQFYGALFYLDKQTQWTTKNVARSNSQTGFTSVLATANDDLNHDGLGDLIAVGDNKLSIWHGPIAKGKDPSDILQVDTTYSNASNVALETVDWNTDGLPDIVLTRQNEVGVFLQNTDNSFKPMMSIHTTEITSGSHLTLDRLAAIDINGDGIKEPVTLYHQSHYTSSYETVYDSVFLQAYFEDGTVWATPAAIDLNQLSSIEDTAFADLDNDGKTDLVVLSKDVADNIHLTTNLSMVTNNLWTLIQNQDHLFENNIAGKVAVGNINGDEYPDIVINHIYNDYATRTISVFFNDKHGMITENADKTIVNKCNDRLWLRDLDKDGDDDLLCQAYLQLSLNRLGNPGNGQFEQPQVLVENAFQDAQKELSFFDVDSDLDEDILLLARYRNALYWGENRSH